MNNTNILIVVIIVIVIVLGVFWFFGGGFSAATPEEGTVFPDEVTDEVAAVQVASSDTLGEYATDSFGMTLYTTTKAECTGDCLSVWPPYGAAAMMAEAGGLGTILRGDTGAYQYTWNGDALYYYSGDSVPGEINGDGIGGVWSVARP